MNTRVILDNIRSIHNVGSIFRTSSGAGVSEIILVGITPGPQDLRLSKTALGAEKEVQYSLYNNFREFKNSKSFDLSLVVSVEQDDRSIGLREFTEILKKEYRHIKDLYIVFGNEITGVSKQFLEFSSYVVELPMLGKKNSLNVSCAAAIVLYYLILSLDDAKTKSDFG